MKEELSWRLTADAARKRTRREAEEEQVRSRRLALNASRQRTSLGEESENQCLRRQRLNVERYHARSAS